MSLCNSNLRQSFSEAVTYRIAGHRQHTRLRLKHMQFVQRSARPEASQM